MGLRMIWGVTGVCVNQKMKDTIVCVNDKRKFESELLRNEATRS